jgi:hypothetical protein
MCEFIFDDQAPSVYFFKKSVAAYLFPHLDLLEAHRDAACRGCGGRKNKGIYLCQGCVNGHAEVVAFRRERCMAALLQNCTGCHCYYGYSGMRSALQKCIHCMLKSPSYPSHDIKDQVARCRVLDVKCKFWVVPSSRLLVAAAAAPTQARAAQTRDPEAQAADALLALSRPVAVLRNSRQCGRRRRKVLSPDATCELVKHLAPDGTWQLDVGGYRITVARV